MSSRLTGLMKYRYQKKEAERIDSITCSSQRHDTGENCTRSSLATANPGSPILQPIPYNSMNQTDGSTSPVIQQAKVRKTCAVSADIKTSHSGRKYIEMATQREQQVDSARASKCSPVIDVNGEPVMSYKCMKQQNTSSSENYCLSSPVMPHQSSLSPSCEKTRCSVTAEDRDMLCNISGLLGMFPNKHQDEIKQALRAAQNDFDIAVDFLIDNKFAEYTVRAKKRKLSGGCDFSSPELSPIAKPNKRLRRLSFDEDDSFTQSTPSTQGKTEAQVVMDKINSLQMLFPLLPRQVIASTLSEHDFDVNETQEALNKTCKQQVSQTENAGSIKAVKQARIHAMTSGQVSAQPNVDKIKESSKSRHRGQLDTDSGEEWKDGDDSSEEELEDAFRGHESKILKFFNEAAITDLISIDGCSMKKASIIMERRPFKSWKHLIEEFEQRTFISLELLYGCKELLRIREVVRKLILKCQRLSREMETVMSELMDKVSLDDSNNEYIRQQPATLNPQMKLTQYQLVGLNWLIVMDEHELNGILGDEMGLGKTIQTIAFLAYMKEQGIDGPHLIIAPSSTLDNWLRELKIWCPTLKVMLYYGNKEERTLIRRQLTSGSHEEFDVAITTYNVGAGSAEDRSFFKKFDWHYAIFDEGHMLKNMSSARYKALTKIKAKRRLLLTGTPLQNNLIELMSLLAFVMPDIFTDKTEHLKKIFSSMSGKSTGEERSAYELENITHAKQILKPFFLRRLKVDVLQQLPKKIEIVKFISLTPQQRCLYDDLKNHYTETLKQEGTVGQGGSVIMMKLRRAANHKLLHRNYYGVDQLKKMAKAMLKEPTHYDSVEQYVFEDMEVMSDFELHQLCKRYKSLHKYQLNEELIMESGKFIILDELLPEAAKQDSRVLLFSQFTIMLDIIEVYMNKRGYKYLRLDGTTPVSERLDLIDKFNTDSSLFVFLLSTKSGGLGINLTAADVVIIHDIDFNPYNDKQAEDRCHRLGQEKEVKVYRLIAINTIEESMMKCAQGKLQLEQDITRSKGDNGNIDVTALVKDALNI